MSLHTLTMSLEKYSGYPVKTSSGTLRLADGSSARFKIDTQGPSNTPVSLTFTAFNSDGTVKNSHATDSTLYFNAQGDIVDRAPLNTHTSAAKLKAMYAPALLECLGDNADEIPWISGFFKSGDDGINRVVSGTSGKMRRVVNDAL